MNRKSANTTFKEVPQTAQQLYIKKHHRHHHLVALLRLLVLISFLLIWEFSGRLGLIDTFFFSSPCMVVSFFVEMLRDGSFFTHTGITLLETLISFLLITIMVFQNPVRNHRTLSCRPQQSAQICPCASVYCLAWHRHQHHYRCRNFCGGFWLHHKSLYRI